MTICSVSTLILGVVNNAYANPQGGVVASGVANITENGAKLDVNQQTDKAVIDWRSFNIDVNEHTQFTQPSASAVALNRINDVNPSQILGKLTANGNIILINPNGVFFGKNSQVDVSGLVASTANITNEDFIAGKMNFHGEGNPNASIINEGMITAKEAGLVGLIAPNVENNGVINAKLGTVHLASGDSFTLDLSGYKLYELKVSDQVKSQLIKNSGVINAEGGTIAITAAAGKQLVDSLVTIKGELKAPTVYNKNGEIIIAAAGSNKTSAAGNSTVLLDGAKIDVSGNKAGEKAGSVTVTGDQIALINGAEITANGDAGGGTVRIGGEYQGKGSTPTAKKVIMDSGTSIKANATGNGNGGEVILWSDDTTKFYGNIEAKGGATGGNGGFVETSGKEKLIAMGFVNASSALGSIGTWLLDPNNISIQTADSNSNLSSSPNFDSTNDNAVLSVSSLESALNAGTSVTVQTTSSGANTQAGNITVYNDISKTSGGDATLTLKANNTIALSNANITSTSNKLNLVMNADTDQTGGGAVSMQNGSITTNGGNLTIGGGADPTTTAAKGNSSNSTGVYIQGTTINTGAGNISIRGAGYDSGSSNYGIRLLSSAVLQTTTGTINLTGTGGNGTGSNYGILMVDSGTKISSADGDITLNATGGSGSSTYNMGFYLQNGADIISTGTGKINITGTGGSGTSYNYGAYVTGTGTTISSVDGDITFTATGGSGSSSDNYGAYIDNGGSISSTGTGKVTITGTGGNGTSYNYGSFISGSTSSVSAVNGDISITGTGRGSGTANYGTFVAGSSILSTGTGKITITGTGGNGTSQNRGIYMNGSTTKVRSANGDITITGTGGNGSLSGNVGSYIFGGADILSIGAGTGAAKITISGTGGTGTDSNYGTIISGSGTTVSSVDGNITITGTGGNASTYNNYGVGITSSAVVSSTGAGTNAANVTITGTGGNGTYNNYGAYISGSTSAVTSVDGDITITGTGGSGTTSNSGIVLSSSENGIQSTNGDISITGTGGSGASGANYGVRMDTGSDIATSGSSTVYINATKGNGSSKDMYVSSTGSVIGGASSTGSIHLTMDDYNIDSDTSFITLNDIILRPNLTSSTVGIGDSGSSTLQVTSTLLATFNEGRKLIIGSESGTGAMTVEATNWLNGNVELRSNSGVISFTGASTNLADLTLTTNASPSASANISGTGLFTFQQATASKSLSVGSSGTADIILSDSFLSKIGSGNFAGGYLFGLANGGSISSYLTSWSKALTFLTGSNFTNGAALSSDDTILVKAGGNITLNSSISTTSSSANALVLSSIGNFYNNVGSTALSASNSRWLVYSNKFANNRNGGLVATASETGKTYATDAPSTIRARRHELTIC